MSRQGIILNLQGPQALISTSRRGICDSCSDKATCSFESALGKDVPEEVMADNPINAQPGDYVEFDLPELGELKLSILIWGLPLAGLTAGAVIGHQIGNSDPASIIGAFAGLVLAFIPIVIYDRIAGKQKRHTHTIIRVVKGPCNTP